MEDHQLKLDVLNHRLLQLQAKPDDTLPLLLSDQRYIFEVQLLVRAPRSGSRILVHSSSESPQRVLIRYLVDWHHHTSYDRACALLGDLDVAHHLANMVTPNLDTSQWIQVGDLETIALLIAPLWLTVEDMRSLVRRSPCRHHLVSSDITEPTAFVKKVMDAPEIFDFVPFLQTDQLESDKVYSTYSLRWCG